ncbi:MAG: VOC family protein [Candidatus Sericytochromatia bacterium]
MKEITKLSHIALIVKDLEKMLSFYQDYAEMNVIHHRIDEGIKVAWLQLDKPDGLIIVMIEVKNSPESGYQRFNHFGFDANSKEKVDEISKKLENTPFLVHKAQDGGKVLGYFCMIKDPEGNQLEFAYGQMRV